MDASGSMLTGPAADPDPLFSDGLVEQPRMTHMVLLRVGVLAAIGAVSFVASVMVLIFRMRQRRISSQSTTPYTLLAHMAIADLLVTSFCTVAENA
ncbi:gonadotropin-releasing hormone receptor-like [Tropilaelaps mercedesae]|uniref:Gonadotropin-releasing hormone receptor-like n=1 Tax=Tropilaelaps mercedesae TaxID=418985 RepID=A0A1V9X5W1_9ACAR|nr:gonadotropin-releasing hormone receptor-like [Tropilaelaps mercedesae]